MPLYIVARALAAVPVWLGVSILAFAIANLAPGDPAEIILQRQTGDPPSAAEVSQLRSRMGLDDPVAERYARWLTGALQGNLGTSYRSGIPVRDVLADGFPATLRLTVAALLIGLAIAIPAGVAAAVFRGSLVDHASRFVALTGAAFPSFVIGYVLIFVFAVSFQWLPVAGSGDLAHFILPALTLGIVEAAALTRLTRTSMLDVLHEDYVRSARAKGVPASRVFFVHALRNALNPVVTLTGVRFGKLMGGALIVETLYARPGLGKTIVESIFDRDYPTIQGFVLFTGTLFLLVNLVIDISYVWLDPRIQQPSVAGANDR